VSANACAGSSLDCEEGNGIVARKSGGLNHSFASILVPDYLRSETIAKLQESLGAKLKTLGNLRPM
jgi:hypothetical protein